MSSEQLQIETLNDAKLRNVEKIKCFRNSNISELINLADKIEKCTQTKPCKCLACSVCLRSFRKRYLKKYTEILNALHKKCDIFYISPICRTPLNLQNDSINDFKNWLKSRLVDYGFVNTPIIGGVDYSYNIKQKSNITPYWCQHFHFLIITYQIKGFAEALRRIFRNDGMMVKQAVRVSKPLESELDIKKCLNYTIPAFFEKRYSYKTLSNRNYTKNWELAPKQNKEIYLFLSSAKPRDLMLKNNVAIKGGLK